VEVELNARFLSRSESARSELRGYPEEDKYDKDEVVIYEVGIFDEAQWEKSEAIESVNGKSYCSNKRKYAGEIMQVGIKHDGSWAQSTAQLTNREHMLRKTLHSKQVPHMYRFAVMDCSTEIERRARRDGRPVPRILTEITIKGIDNGVVTQFSYEQVGMLQLNMVLFVVLASMLYSLVSDYRRQIARTDRWFSPHPIMIVSSSIQVLGVLFSALSLWSFSYNGEGYILLDVLSKIFDGLSETVMSILLIEMASGWTLTYANVDLDEQIEVYIPVVLLIAMVHIIIATLTFVDIDSQHKHHDYAGLQG